MQPPKRFLFGNTRPSCHLPGTALQRGSRCNDLYSISGRPRTSVTWFLWQPPAHMGESARGPAGTHPVPQRLVPRGVSSRPFVGWDRDPACRRQGTETGRNVVPSSTRSTSTITRPSAWRSLHLRAQTRQLISYVTFLPESPRNLVEAGHEPARKGWVSYRAHSPAFIGGLPGTRIVYHLHLFLSSSSLPRGRSRASPNRSGGPSAVSSGNIIRGPSGGALVDEGTSRLSPFFKVPLPTRRSKRTVEMQPHPLWEYPCGDRREPPCFRSSWGWESGGRTSFKKALPPEITFL